ncbi:hypothetical protein [Chrysiogenes arsenatis]|uniref:hypothetical protein n=1 Tax=Chrysiogenes arsenatis TaxID=309797 RepID=UPI0003F9D257|nr:hypothetical protein [Chrysiogenes arsenatis]
MSQPFNIFRETVLPGTLEAYSIYLIAPAARPDFVEMYVTGSSGSIVKRAINADDVQSMIDASMVSGGANSIEMVADITERDALVATLEANALILVLDASADATVTSGSATYAYRHSNTSLTKISESESMDVALSWANITGKPSSSVTDIDDAVSKRHAHTNATELNKIGESGGHMTYGGKLPVTGWNSVGW